MTNDTLYHTGEVCKLANITVRTLHYYHDIGLLQATEITESGHHLYDENALKRLQHILFLRELEFSLDEISTMLDSTKFDRQKALEDQITLLKMRRDRLNGLILFAQSLQMKGDSIVDFTVFDNSKIKEYEKTAKEKWGHTEAYQEYARKANGRTPREQKDTGLQLMDLFREFGEIEPKDPSSDAAQAQVQKLRIFITEHYYTCTVPILSSLGAMYTAGGEMTDNIDAAGGEGCAVFAAEAINIYCKNSGL